MKFDYPHTQFITINAIFLDGTKIKVLINPNESLYSLKNLISREINKRDGGLGSYHNLTEVNPGVFNLLDKKGNILESKDIKISSALFPNETVYMVHK